MGVLGAENPFSFLRDLNVQTNIPQLLFTCCTSLFAFGLYIISVQIAELTFMKVSLLIFQFGDLDIKFKPCSSNASF